MLSHRYMLRPRTSKLILNQSMLFTTPDPKKQPPTSM